MMSTPRLTKFVNGLADVVDSEGDGATPEVGVRTERLQHPGEVPAPFACPPTANSTQPEHSHDLSVKPRVFS